MFISPFSLSSHASSGNGKHPNLWILDTGATDHISHNLSLFNNHKIISPISVRLPDGSQTITSICGIVHVSPYLTLHNVLYIPSFHVNLISIAKLVTSNNCVVQFNVNSYHIMQSNSKARISIADMQRGLYVPDSIGKHFSYSSITNNACNLWHLRLKHISHLRLQVTSKVFPFIPCKIKICLVIEGELKRRKL